MINILLFYGTIIHYLFYLINIHYYWGWFFFFYLSQQKVQSDLNSNSISLVVMCLQRALMRSVLYSISLSFQSRNLFIITFYINYTLKNLLPSILTLWRLPMIDPGAHRSSRRPSYTAVKVLDLGLIWDLCFFTHFESKVLLAVTNTVTLSLLSSSGTSFLLFD